MTHRMAKLDRLLSLVHALVDAPEGMTLDEMAQHLEVNRRTAERLRDVIMLHFDLEPITDGRIKRWRIAGRLGRMFTTPTAEELAALPRIVLICGHYEGVDERVRIHLANREISIGDYVLTGGELPAMVVVDSVARLVPGVLGNAESASRDSHAAGLLEHPHYTRPAEYGAWRVPDVLLSGNHREIDRWRRRESLGRTRARRPDLLEKAVLTEEDRTLLAELEEEARGKS